MGMEQISKDTARVLQDWLNDDLAAAREDDPSVGIFRNEELVTAIELLQEYIEEKTGVPAKMVKPRCLGASTCGGCDPSCPAS